MSKYIIDVGDAYTKHICGKGDMLCLPVRINEFEDNWMNTDIPLTPYTEPDLDAIRNEAYEKGVQDTKQHWVDAPRSCAYKLGYAHGLYDAWDAARKIANMPYGEEEKVFGSGGWTFIEKHTASEAIEKIRQYEQEKEEQITKGDVVRIKSAPEVEIFVTYADEECVSGIALTEVDDSYEIGDQYTDIRIHKVEKTGRHYEIAAVLAKMKEKQP